MFTVEDLYRDYKEPLKLELVLGSETLDREIFLPEVQRPGLSLAGFLKKFEPNRVLVFGSSEILYLQDLKSGEAKSRLSAILAKETPAVIVSGGEEIPSFLHDLCDKEALPLFKTSLRTIDLLSKATFCLGHAMAPATTCHGTFIEAFGVGVLIQGDSSVGKSEAALGLIDRGHRLISDDVVKLSLREDSLIEGSGTELNKHMLEIRGIGILNVAHLYGAVCVRGSKSLDLIVKLEDWDDEAFYDRVGLDERFTEMLGVNIPYHILPVKPGRDVVLLLETIILNYRLKLMGYHSAREFNVKLLETISRKQQQQQKRETYSNN